MQQPAVDNRTDFAVHPQVLLDRYDEKLAVIVKATYELEADGTLRHAPAERTRSVRGPDIPWDEKRPESLAYPGDIFLRKSGTDVVVVATAYAPGGRPTRSFDVRVEVGHLQKSLVIFGQRLWTERGSELSTAAPITEIDMRYDYAWGGTDDSDPDDLREEPRNPIGMGVTRRPDALTHKPAPHIEDPAFPIRSSKTAPPPAGIGVVGRHWEPRRGYAGTYDQAWQELRAPLLPDDFDDRFNQCASPGLGSDTPLVGGEPVRLLNLTPMGGALAFDLPRIIVEIELQVKGREREIFTPHLDTLLVDLYAIGPEKPAAIEMVWRAAVKAPRRLKDARIVVRERRSP